MQRLHTLVPTLIALAATGAEFTPIATTPTPAPVPAPNPVVPLPRNETPVASGSPLVVTATRLSEDAWLQPYALHQHDRSALDDTNARTLTDMLNYTPGVYVQHTAPNQASPYIRGLTGDQTLLLFDGVRLSHAGMRSGPNQYAAMIPNEAIGRVDTILGSSSTVTGSDGLTGALDFRLAEAGRGATETIRPFAGTRYGSADGASAFAGIDGRSHNVSYSAEVSHAEYHDLRGGKDAGDHLFGDAAGSQRIPNTDYRQYGWGARAAYDGLDQHRFELAAGFQRQTDAPRPDGYAENSGNANRISRYYEPQDFSYIHARHAARYDGPVERVQSTVWWHEHDETQIREDISGGRYRKRIAEDTISTLGLDVQLGSRVAIVHDLTYGATMSLDQTANDFTRYRSPTTDPDLVSGTPDQTGSANPGTTTVPDDSSFTSFGVFIQDSWQVAERWNILGGLRLSQYAWDFTVTDDRAGFDWIDGVSGNNDPNAKLDVSDSTQAVTANIRVGWQATDTIYGFTGIGQGFRAPTLVDLAGSTDRASGSSGGSGPQTTGNVELDPEQSLTWEVGSRWQQERDQASVTVFYTALEDLIQTVYTDVDNDGDIDTADRADKINSESGRLYGFEIANDIAIPTFGWLGNDYRTSVIQSTSLVRGRVDVPQPSANGAIDTENISRANLLFGKAGMKVSHDNGWWGMLQVRYQAGYNHVTDGDANDTRHTTFPAKGKAGAMPGFGVVDLLLGYHAPNDRYRVTASLENIFDRSYRPVGSGTDGAGFNAVLGLEGRF